jgi:hypothetical protein
MHTVDGCEILHQLIDGVYIPLFCWGLSHPFGDAGFLPFLPSTVYQQFHFIK